MAGPGSVDEAIARVAMSYAERAANACIGHERADLVLAGLRHLGRRSRSVSGGAVAHHQPGIAEGIVEQHDGRDGVGPHRRPRERWWRHGPLRAARAAERSKLARINPQAFAQPQPAGSNASSMTLMSPPGAREAHSAAYELIKMIAKHKFLKSGQPMTILGLRRAAGARVAAPRVDSRGQGAGDRY